MQLTYTEDPVFRDQIHGEDLRYMLEHTYTDTSFFLQTLTEDDNTFTFWGDVQKNLYFVSDSLRDSFGFARNKVSDFPNAWMKRIYNPIDLARYNCAIEDLMNGDRDVYNMRYQVSDVRGEVFWVHGYGQLKWNEDHTKPLFFCGKITRQDVELVTDPVSNFAGESILINHLTALDRMGRGSTCIGFSLNYISKINGIQGRTYSDQMIRNIARELTLACPARMPFYRVDGARFIAVVSDSVQESHVNMVEKIRQIVHENYKKMGMPVSHSCSFAVMRYPRAELTPMDFVENMLALIHLARQEEDIPYLDENSEAVLRMQQRANMELLLNKNVMENMTDFRAVVQPVVSTKTGKIIGGETLMRWKYDDMDVSPGVFIPILEKSTLIQTAGRWIFEQAVQICKKAVEIMPDFYLTVNVSLRQLYDTAFFDFIPETLRKYQLPGQHIVVEMTESCIDREPQKVFELFEVCKSCGIRIALDDFGTGYSSMRVLLQYPLSIVKIDRSLLLEMSESREKYNFISSIVFACHQFGKTVCIEGVENDKQRELSCFAGCDMIQGFYYYRPTEIQDLYPELEKQ